MKSPVTAILALIVVIGAWYLAQKLLVGYVISMTSSKATECLELAGNTTAEEAGQTYIIGSVRNNCDRSFGEVTTLFKLDRRTPGVDLPETVIYAYTRDLKPGETQRFKSFLSIPKRATYRFDGFSAY